jgi:large subunit ribosomal protein L3
MSIGLVGRKCGMTRIFNDAGAGVGVTVISAEPNRVTQVKTAKLDGYSAIQVTTGEKRTSLLNKPEKGHFAKAGAGSGRGLWEFRLEESDLSKYPVGAEIKTDVFKVGDLVDVTGTTKGKGFAGTIKRHNFTMGDATHGNSLSHRAPGSLGQRQTPGRVFPGKKMSGHMGDVRQTTQNLRVIRIDAERNLIMVQGAVPGAANGDVIIRPAAKG